MYLTPLPGAVNNQENRFGKSLKKEFLVVSVVSDIKYAVSLQILMETQMLVQIFRQGKVMKGHVEIQDTLTAVNRRLAVPK